MTLQVRPATLEDVLSISQRLRPADLKEIYAAGNKTPEESLMKGLESPDGCYVAVDAEDVPQVIFGTTPSEEPLLGFVWMMATEDIHKYWVQILRETRKWVKQLSAGYTILANAAHKDNYVHIRWLQWAGFTILREIEINGQPFYEFAKMIPPEERTGV